MFSGFTASFSGLGLLHSCKKDIWTPHRSLFIEGGITTWHLLSLKETHFFKSPTKLCKKLGEKVLREKGTPGLGRPPASLWRIQCGLQMLTTATNCLMSTSLNIPMWRNQGGGKKIQDPLQAFKNSRPITAVTVHQTFLYACFIAHSHYTFVLSTS